MPGEAGAARLLVEGEPVLEGADGGEEGDEGSPVELPLEAVARREEDAEAAHGGRDEAADVVDGDDAAEGGPRRRRPGATAVSAKRPYSFPDADRASFDSPPIFS